MILRFGLPMTKEERDELDGKLLSPKLMDVGPW